MVFALGRQELLVSRAMNRLSNFLIYSGVGIAVLGTIGYAVGGWINLPAEVVRVIAFALPFVVGGGLMGLGAMLGRTARKEAELRDALQRQSNASRRNSALHEPMPTLDSTGDVAKRPAVNPTD